MVTAINSYVGSVGSPNRQEHAVVGDVVNASARLSGKGKQGGAILCDQTTFDAVKGAIKMRPEGEIQVITSHASLIISFIWCLSVWCFTLTIKGER
jgi:class 3 adenylate cyclase